MAEVLITVLGASVLTPIVAFIIKVIDQRMTPPAAGPAPVVGTPVQAPDWAERSYQAAMRELADERREHAVCHQIMRAAGIDPPPDHATD